ncbi:MAG: hypothetical protein PHW56_07635 [Methanosarcinaceae archaeon]|nr:hypothetical protein [Methanosarcinaceae archaeon]
MSLPDVCPLDDKPCKERECHLYCVEWRTHEPLCLVGYGSTGKIGVGKALLEDTYAENTFKKLGINPVSGKQTISAKEAEDENPAEKKRGKFKPWPEFPVKKHMDEVPEESNNGKLRARKSVRPEEGLKPEETGRNRETPGHDEAEKASLRHETHLRRNSADEKELRIKKPPEFKEKVVSKDIHATIISSISEPEKPDEGWKKSRKFNKIMEIDLPDEYEEEFWS